MSATVIDAEDRLCAIRRMIPMVGSDAVEVEYWDRDDTTSPGGVLHFRVGEVNLWVGVHEATGWPFLKRVEDYGASIQEEHEEAADILGMILQVRVEKALHILYKTGLKPISTIASLHRQRMRLEFKREKLREESSAKIRELDASIEHIRTVIRTKEDAHG